MFICLHYFTNIAVTWERRNHSLKYESTVFSQELVLTYESWKVLQEIVPYEFLSSTPQPNREILFQNKFSIPLCLSYENCKCPRRNHTSKRENCFAIFKSVCNFHICLQFSYLFAILTFRCTVPMWTFAIFIWVCYFHMSLQCSYISLQFSRYGSRLLTYVASYRFPCSYELELITPRQPRFSMEETKKN
jgi:hypothetical protein